MAIRISIAFALLTAGSALADTVLHAPLVNPPTVSGVYILADDFRGEAAIILDHADGVTLRNFSIRGNRARLAQTQGLPPYDRTFATTFQANGVLLRGGGKLRIEAAQFSEIAGFAVLATGVQGLTLTGLKVTDSGSLKPNGRNNTTGGILIEDGACDFEVSLSRFERITGNAVWTHSRYTARRNERGLIRANTFLDIGRDAIQIGHAVSVRVEANQGDRIGYPVAIVDMEGGGTPVGIDTAGNVEGSAYVANEFTTINGKCIDLDGFHHGEVSRNVCTNPPGDYPFGHFGIVMNNTNPDMQSVAIRIHGNRIHGAKWGGIFVIGSGHTIEKNTLTGLQQTHCSDPAILPNCVFVVAEPNMLRTGIYLGQKAERPAVTRGNRIVDNEVSGWRMDRACIGYAPLVKASENTVHANRCRHQTDHP